MDTFSLLHPHQLLHNKKSLLKGKKAFPGANNNKAHEVAMNSKVLILFLKL